MLEKNMNIAITPCYGNSNTEATRAKLNIPKDMANALGITKENNKVNVKCNPRKKQIIITKIESEE